MLLAEEPMDRREFLKGAAAVGAATMFGPELPVALARPRRIAGGSMLCLLYTSDAADE